MLFPTQLVKLGSTFHKIAILVFGYLIPALSSVKAVVRKDTEAYHQWTTYWLILHLYLTILSPILHVTLHPFFQLLAILWLSLPRYQGASVVYERLVVPWVDKYEEKVDEAVDEAHRGVRRWVMAKFGRIVWMLMGEGFGSVLDGVQFILRAATGGGGQSSQSWEKPASQEDFVLKSSNSMESLPPRHSIKEALSQSSIDDLANDAKERSSDGDQLSEFVCDFMSMLHQGLYVFANIEVVDESIIDDGEDDIQHEKRRKSIFEGGYKLGIFSYHGPLCATGVREGSFLVSPAVGGGFSLAGNHASEESSIESVSLSCLRRMLASGSQGLLLESRNGAGTLIKTEIVLSDERDRDILLNGLNQCLQCLLP